MKTSNWARAHLQIRAGAIVLAGMAIALTLAGLAVVLSVGLLIADGLMTGVRALVTWIRSTHDYRRTNTAFGSEGFARRCWRIASGR